MRNEGGKPGIGFAVIAELEGLEKELSQLTDLSRRLGVNVVGDALQVPEKEKPADGMKDREGVLPSVLKAAMNFRDRVRDANKRLEKLIDETAYRRDDSDPVGA